MHIYALQPACHLHYITHNIYSSLVPGLFGLLYLFWVQIRHLYVFPWIVHSFFPLDNQFFLVHLLLSTYIIIAVWCRQINMMLIPMVTWYMLCMSVSLSSFSEFLVCCYVLVLAFSSLTSASPFLFSSSVHHCSSFQRRFVARHSYLECGMLLPNKQLHRFKISICIYIYMISQWHAYDDGDGTAALHQYL